ncbi:Asp/Glu racemase [Rhizobium sp. L1K21]|uniref:maleate cis-trans isomerase family protein n=1 Tax=Rhizobium sp. L1K21 TaxID=2954933 RepID=UPI002092C01C|nr:Asp/Glu racemase [Rhizobium sp. L1K21]MCO6186783.1 Asp/Glu racemase [Rhizobium sp. L1K21]
MTEFAYSLEDKSTQRAHLGLVVLQSDESIERDFRHMLPSEAVSLYVTRVASDPEVSSENLAKMKNRIEAAAGLLPRPVTYHAIGYGCTSGTSVIGVDEVSRQLHAGCSAKAATQPVSALLAAAKALGVTRLAFLSPYVEEVSSHLRNVLADNGLQSPVFGTFNEAREERVAWIDGPSILKAAKALAQQGGVDAIFMSCTNLRTLGVIEQIEAETDLPALSSNQVLCWHMMRLAGLDDRMNGFGRLFREA